MSLYKELGGEPAIETALDVFYEKIDGDPRFDVFFDGVDIDRVKRHQAAFFATALGGPNAYDGRELQRAHRKAVRKGLDEELFDAFMDHFRDTLQELDVPEGAIAEVMEVTYSGKDQVLAG